MEEQRKPEQEKQTDDTIAPETTTERTPEHQAPQETEANNNLDPQTAADKIIKELEQLAEQGKWDEAKAKIEDVKKSDLPPTDKGEIYTKFALMYARQKTEADQPYKEALEHTTATLKRAREEQSYWKLWVINKARLIVGWTLLPVSVVCLIVGIAHISAHNKLKRADAHYQKGFAYVRNGIDSKADRVSAFAELREAIRVNPKHIAAYNALGNLHSSYLDYPSGEAAFQKALALSGETFYFTCFLFL